MESGGAQRRQGADKSIEYLSSSKTGELEGKRMRTSHFRLELYLVERRRNPLHAGHCVLAKCNAGFVSAHQHGLNVGCAAEDAQDCRGKEGAGRLRQHSKPIARLFAQGFDLGDVRHMSEPPVYV